MNNNNEKLGLLLRIDRAVDLEYILYAFWALFWLFNGLDKFYNGNWVVNESGYATKGVLIDTITGNATHTLQPMQPEGWFGVNRDSKTIGYFARLGLPASLAIGSLYSIAVVEVVIGILFAAIFVNKVIIRGAFDRYSLFETDAASRIAFKSAMIIFLLFSFADVMFGDRTELWEHGTFMLLVLLTYQLYIQRESIEEIEERGLAKAAKDYESKSD
jgi:TM2 domain-containing membrane protein YozV